jgi:ACT domain-containing protein
VETFISKLKFSPDQLLKKFKILEKMGSNLVTLVFKIPNNLVGSIMINTPLALNWDQKSKV